MPRRCLPRDDYDSPPEAVYRDRWRRLEVAAVRLESALRAGNALAFRDALRTLLALIRNRPIASAPARFDSQPLRSRRIILLPFED